eukprot:Gb_09257 [translate_table: standard]
MHLISMQWLKHSDGKNSHILVQLPEPGLKEEFTLQMKLLFISPINSITK